MAPPSKFKEGGSVYDYEFVNKTEKIAIVERETFFPFEFISSEDKIITQPVVRNINHNLDLEFCLTEIEKIALNKSRFIHPTTGIFDRSSLDYSIILTLTNKGAPRECIEEALSQTRHDTHYQRLYRKKYNGHVRAYENFERSYNKAILKGDSEGFKKNADIAARLTYAVKMKAWRGKGALNDRDALLAHIQVFGRCKKRGWDLSVREGSQLGEMSISAFYSSTNRLIASGYLIQVKAASNYKSESACYDFGVKCLEMLHEGTHTHVKTEIGICNRMQLEEQETYGVFETRRGLGKSAKEICRAVDNEPSNRQKISDVTGRHKSTVSRVTRLLLEYGLVKEIDGIIYPVVNFDFESLAEELGTTNIASNRKRQHDWERENWAIHISQKRDQFKKSTPPKS